MHKLNLLIIFGISLTLLSCGTSEESGISSEDKSSLYNTSISESLGSDEMSSIEHIHNWGEVIYTWNNDHTKLKATRICNSDNTHKEEEEVDVSKSLGEDSTCSKEGYYLYTSDAFANCAFEVQTYREVISLKPHTLTYTQIDATNHMKHCSVCNQDIGEEVHRYDNGEILTYAYISHGDLYTGTIKYTCLDCGYEDIREHNHTELEI